MALRREWGNPRQLTHLDAFITGFPHWSPDGKAVVFHARTPDIGQLYVVRVNDGAIRQLTHGKGGFVATTCSGDGKFVYALQEHGGATILYRVPVDGSSPQPLWPGCVAVEAPRRNLLLYAKLGQPGIYARSLSGDPLKTSEIRLLQDYRSGDFGFAPVKNGIYYIGGCRASEGFPFLFL